jgi:hypothetical protein
MDQSMFARLIQEIMPPKKRKATGGGGSMPLFMLLLKYESGGGYNELERHETLYSTKEKAIAGMPHLMDTYAHYGDDWKNGVEGFGKEEEDPYLGFEYFGDSIGDKGGDVLTNKDSDGSNTITVSLQRMRVDPPDPPKSKKKVEEDQFVSEICF